MNYRKKDPDAALIDAFIGRDNKDAFEKLFDRYQDTVYGFCYRFLGNEDDAADCTQEIFISVYRGLVKFGYRSLFSTWLYRITINACYDAARARSKRMVTGPFDQMEHKIGAGFHASPPDPEKILAAKEINEAFQGGLSRLKKSQRTMIILRDLEGRSYEEIGALAGMKPGTVRSTLARARYRMAEHLKDYRYGM